MKVKEIVQRVRAAIDELTAGDSQFSGVTSDEANLRTVIIDKIPYALTYIIENATEDKLDGSMLTLMKVGDSVTATDGKPVLVKLPDNVLRIVSARLSSWSLSPAPVSERSQEYLMQQDPYARGSWDRPVTAIRHKGDGRYLELYSAKDAQDQVEVSYIAKPVMPASVTDETAVAVPSRLEGAFVYQVAGLTMVAFREQLAQQLFTIAHDYLTSTFTNREQQA